MEVYSFIFSPIGVNTYVLADKSGECAIVDCGCFYEEEFDKLVSFIEEKKLHPVLLLDTHCHLDHIFGNKKMLDKYNLKAYSHKEEEYNRKNAVKDALSFGLQMDVPPVPAGYVEDGQEFSFGETTLKAIFVPGHTAGSMAYYNEKDGIVLTGDALFEGSIGRTDLYGGDYDQLINSIRTRLFTLPPDTIICPGHGGDTSVSTEIESNPYFNEI